MIYIPRQDWRARTPRRASPPPHNVGGELPQRGAESTPPPANTKNYICQYQPFFPIKKYFYAKDQAIKF